MYYFSTFFHGPIEVVSRPKGGKHEKYNFAHLGFTFKLRLREHEEKMLISQKAYAEGDRVLGEEVSASVETLFGKLAVRHVISNPADGSREIATHFEAEVAPRWTLHPPRLFKRKNL